MKIVTDRLYITPMSQAELSGLVEKYKAVEVQLSEAYAEMLENCKRCPKQQLWYTAWEISEKESGCAIGYAGFKGLSKDGICEIGYGIDKDYEGRGYATEAAGGICRWALSQPGVKGIEAEAEADNHASVNVLKKLGFCANGQMGEEGPRYVLKNL